MIKDEILELLLWGPLTEAQIASKIYGTGDKIGNVARAIDDLMQDGLILKCQLKRKQVSSKVGPLPHLCTLNVTEEGRLKLEKRFGIEKAVLYLRQLNEDELLSLVDRCPQLGTVAHIIRDAQDTPRWAMRGEEGWDYNWYVINIYPAREGFQEMQAEIDRICKELQGKWLEGFYLTVYNESPKPPRLKLGLYRVKIEGIGMLWKGLRRFRENKVWLVGLTTPDLSPVGGIEMDRIKCVARGVADLAGKKLEMGGPERVDMAFYLIHHTLNQLSFGRSQEFDVYHKLLYVTERKLIEAFLQELSP